MSAIKLDSKKQISKSMFEISKTIIIYLIWWLQFSCLHAKQDIKGSSQCLCLWMHGFHVAWKMYEPEAVAVPQQRSKTHNRYIHYSLPSISQVWYRCTHSGAIYHQWLFVPPILPTDRHFVRITNFVCMYVQCESKKSPPEILWHFTQTFGNF